MRLGVRDGIDGASVRTIAREAGVSEGALYKHYSSKSELIRDAYTTIVEDMARDKMVLVQANLPFEHAIRAWIELTYKSFDGSRDAFTYVLLMPHWMADSLGEVTRCQGQMFREFFAKAVEKGEAKPIEPDIAYALFTGLVLNIPRLINDGSIPGPAGRYTDQIVEAVWRLFLPD